MALITISVSPALTVTPSLAETSTTAPATQSKSVTVSVDASSRVFIDKREVALGALEPELKVLVARLINQQLGEELVTLA